ncbi:MAG TPA: FecR domain-containing protein [Chitinophagaceae bacterium]|nr:FecR domain-containing protein [Chitinophagaceae bacterium]
MDEFRIPENNPDLERAYRTAWLIAGYIRGTLTPAEHDELDEWVAASDANMQLFERLTEEEQVRQTLQWLSALETERRLRQIRSQLPFREPAARPASATFLKKFKPWAIAASVILIGALAIFYGNRSQQEARESPGMVKAVDVPPGGPMATLTLSDGHTRQLSRTDSGQFEAEAGTRIQLSAGGKLRYDAVTLSDSQYHFNVLTTPAGGEYRLQLSDGTRIWLNAASLVRYPTRFPAAERLVELRGEAYFEVAHNPRSPFRVLLPGGDTVTVLGTRFNIQAYPEEPAVTTTLLEGSVRATGRGHRQLLRPGEQLAIRAATGAWELTGDADTSAVVAWKNGFFEFHDRPITEIMRQLTRWYDVDVEYQGDMKGLDFTAIVSRTEPISGVLRKLEATGALRTRVEGRKITVSR